MSNETIDIKTPAGPMKTTICTPEGKGPWPAVIVFADAFGARESIVKIGERLTKSGYLAAVPDFYHGKSPIELVPAEDRAKPGGVMAIFGVPELRAKFFTEFYGPALDYDSIKSNIGPLLDELEKRPDVVKGKIGTTGYCMGGNMSLRTAIVFGDRIAATASFHGGGLATDQADSPDRRASSIKSKVYVAGAIEDDSFNEAAKEQLDKALTSAHVEHQIEWYQAKHGFAVSDHHAAYDPAAEERHFKALEKLYAETLKA